MSGAQTTIELQDKLTAPLQKMIKAMDSTIKVMEQMDSSTQQLDQKTLASARSNIDNASADLNRLASAAQDAGNHADNAAGQQNNFNNSISNAIPKMTALAGGILAAVGAYKAFNAAKRFMGDILERGFGFEILKQQSEAAFTTFLGDAQLAKDYMDELYQFALTTPFQFPDLLDSTRNLIAFGIEAENTIPIMQAIGDAVGGIGGGSAEMQRITEIFGVIQSQGRITAMEVNRLASLGINAYEMLGEAAGVSAGEMKEKISSGAVDSAEAITGLVAGMNDQFGGAMENIKSTLAGTIDSFKSSMRNAGHDLLEDFIEPITTGIQNVTSLISSIPRYIGPAFAAFVPVIDLLNEAFEEGRFDGFFQTLAASINTIAFMIAGAVEGVIWFATVIDEYWPAILAGFMILGVALIPMIISGLWGVASAAIAAWGAVLWPIFIIIAAIGAVIGILMLFGVTSEQILGFVMGLFFALGTYIWNVIAYTWNTILAFAEFLVNVFIDPVYAVKKLFYDLAVNAIDQMAAMAGGFDKAADVLAQVFVAGANIAIGAINGLIKALNMIPGVDIGEVNKISGGATGIVSNALKNFASNMEAPTSSKNVVDFSSAKLSMGSVPGAYNKGYSMGAGFEMPSLGADRSYQPDDLGNLMADIANGLDGIGGSAPGGSGGAGGKGSANPTGGHLDSIGKIDKEINIADEDLKLLLDMADKDTINQVSVTLTPTVQFKDTVVREEADIDKIISKIDQNLDDEVSKSIKGVVTT